MCLLRFIVELGITSKFSRHPMVDEWITSRDGVKDSFLETFCSLASPFDVKGLPGKLGGAAKGRCGLCF